ncbi:MAG: hypothetical protein FWD06_05920 [Oscillospiraceae bacterium]|nr:hypothetical protein [Oscillospiraceae bacterium]
MKRRWFVLVIVLAVLLVACASPAETLPEVEETTEVYVMTDAETLQVEETTEMQAATIRLSTEPIQLPPNQSLQLSDIFTVRAIHRHDQRYGVHTALYLEHAHTGDRARLPLGTALAGYGYYGTIELGHAINHRFFTYAYIQGNGFPTVGQVFDIQRNRVVLQATVVEIDGDRALTTPPGMPYSHVCCGRSVAYYFYIDELEGDRSPQLRPTNIRLAELSGCQSCLEYFP